MKNDRKTINIIFFATVFMLIVINVFWISSDIYAADSEYKTVNLMIEATDGKTATVNKTKFETSGSFMEGAMNFYATVDGGKKYKFASGRWINPIIVTNGEIVYLNVSSEEKQTVYKINLLSKKKKKMFSVQTSYSYEDFELSGYYKNKIYYIMGLDSGRFCCYDKKTKKNRTLVDEADAAKQKGNIFMLYPYEGDGDNYRCIGIYYLDEDKYIPQD